MRKTINLNGWWDWQLPGGVIQKKAVPSCYPCVGDAIYSRDFELADIASKHVLLHFEGVNYSGAVTVNGQFMGDMLPYVYYDFDITDSVTEGANSIKVLVKDINAKYGSTGGWEDYGGISRDVWVDIADMVGIEDTQWITYMKDNYTAANAELNVWLYNRIGGSADAKVTAKLIYQGEVETETSVDISMESECGECRLSFSLDKIHAWNTDFPNMYQLAIDVECGGMSDSRTMEVGFREFTVKSTDFYLNGVKTFLKGVARHDMWGDQGFTLSREQIEQDLTLIKETGANFIRLVHYPHSRYTVEYAAKIGLMVSEEPGLWWSDLSDEYMISSALEIMKRTVLRDRSNPAVVAWLFFNECHLEHAGSYLKRGAALCRSLDPTRLLSGANCLDNATAKKVFDETGMDFYTQHPYCYEGDGIIKAADILRDKPLVLTEWGGWLIHYNPNLIKLFKRLIAKLAHGADGEPHLNGMCWWQWQDIFQFNRGLPGCEDGLLSDGLVDRFRKRKPTYAVMAEFFDVVEHKSEPLFELTEYPGVGSDMQESLTPIDLSSFYGELNNSLWEEIRSGDKVKHYRFTHIRGGHKGIYIYNEIKTLSGLRCDIPAGRPIILCGERAKIDIPIQRNAEKVCIFGAVSYFDGYPVRGTFGEPTAKITLTYADGSAEEIPMRHGLEIASASLIARNSRLDPHAALAPRVAKITQDYDWEVYAVNLLTVPADETKTLATVSIEALDLDFAPVLFALSIS